MNVIIKKVPDFTSRARFKRLAMEIIAKIDCVEVKARDEPPSKKKAIRSRPKSNRESRRSAPIESP